MKVCKDCGKEVSKSAKTCPNCGKKLKKPIVLFIILGIIALAIIATVFSGNKEKERQKEFKQNEVATYKDINYSITNIERTNGKEFFKASEGKEYILITIKIENKSNEKIPYNVFNWKLADGTGDEKSHALFAGDNDKALSSGDLNAGGTKTGIIGFEIPKGDTGLTLKYYNTILDKERTFEFKIKD